jgi:hypothetical protein
MTMKYLFFIPFILLITMLVACDDRSEYERLVDRELERGVRYDSLFLGYKLGMHRQDFLDYSWKLNQQRVVTGGAQVHYKMEDLSAAATKIFYPDFREDRIYRMPVEISFDSWAIWNREFHSDSLIVQLLKKYEDTYGEGFIYTYHPDLGTDAWIKVDGNRRITIYPKDDRTARVEFLDLSAK